jgi:hypothetical protein
MGRNLPITTASSKRRAPVAAAARRRSSSSPPSGLGERASGRTPTTNRVLSRAGFRGGLDARILSLRGVDRDEAEHGVAIDQPDERHEPMRTMCCISASPCLPSPSRSCEAMTGTRPPTVGPSDRRPARDDERHAPSRQGAPRQAIARVRPGPIERRRALPIRRAPEDVRARWDERELRAAILEGIPVRDASLEIGEDDSDCGRTVTIRLDCSCPCRHGGAGARRQGGAPAEGVVRDGRDPEHGLHPTRP